MLLVVLELQESALLMLAAASPTALTLPRPTSPRRVIRRKPRYHLFIDLHTLRSPDQTNSRSQITMLGDELKKTS